MRLDDALRIVETLAAGCDPVTGEELDRAQIVRRSDVTDALVALVEALQVIRSAIVAPEATPADRDSEQREESIASAYEAALEKFGIRATGGPTRFGRSGWFYVGRAVAACPDCQQPMEAFRCPYTTRAGLRYHYWALLCTACHRLHEPAALGPMRKALYDSSELRPSGKREAEGRT